MEAVVLYESGGPERLKFEDDVPDPQIRLISSRRTERNGDRRTLWFPKLLL